MARLQLKLYIGSIQYAFGFSNSFLESFAIDCQFPHLSFEGVHLIPRHSAWESLNVSKVDTVHLFAGPETKIRAMQTRAENATIV